MRTRFENMGPSRTSVSNSPPPPLGSRARADSPMRSRQPRRRPRRRAGRSSARRRVPPPRPRSPTPAVAGGPSPRRASASGAGSAHGRASSPDPPGRWTGVASPPSRAASRRTPHTSSPCRPRRAPRPARESEGLGAVKDSASRLTLFKVNFSSRAPNDLWPSRGFRRVRLDEMTSEEFAALARADPVVIVPVGALEEHGRHLPLGADMIQPMHIVGEVARRTGAFVAPSIPYGVCTTTRPYPGTVSVSVDAVKAFVRDILADFVRNGVHRVMIVSGHAGREHMMALRAAAQEVVDAGTGLKATVLSDYDIIYASEGILPEDDGHAGAGETSRILTARPELVKGKSPAGKNEIPPYAVVDDPRKYWPGVTGDPAKASKALGEKLDALVIEELSKLVEELRQRA